MCLPLDSGTVVSSAPLCMVITFASALFPGQDMIREWLVLILQIMTKDVIWTPYLSFCHLNTDALLNDKILYIIPFATAHLKSHVIFSPQGRENRTYDILSFPIVVIISAYGRRAGGVNDIIKTVYTGCSDGAFMIHASFSCGLSFLNPHVAC